MRCDLGVCGKEPFVTRLNATVTYRILYPVNPRCAVGQTFYKNMSYVPVNNGRVYIKQSRSECGFLSCTGVVGVEMFNSI